DVTDYKEGAYGGFGGGGSFYRELMKLPNNVVLRRWIGGRGGFGGGGGSGKFNPGRAGEFGGNATCSYDLDICSGGGGAGLGGAVFIREYGEFEASNCLFEYNQAYGGAGSTNFSKFRISGQGKGAAVFVHNASATVCLADCSFSGNESQDADGDFVSTFAHQDNNDIYGAYSPIIPHINFVSIEHYPPLNHTDISYLAQFDADVVGVDITDFGIDSDDPNDTQVASVEEIDPRNYRIIIKHSRNRGFVTLKIIDDDTIRDTVRDHPIGYIGGGNGNFTGETCYIHPTVQISSILPLSGSLKDYGNKTLNGIKLAIADHDVTNTSPA
ncbi:MAG: hypothetical protein GY869_27665, partial [Planctomycetes bacterium]|nr:hypothetical protein [Planctomycetota bacterium]